VLNLNLNLRFARIAFAVGRRNDDATKQMRDAAECCVAREA
jgi:hypothetical protein